MSTITTSDDWDQMSRCFSEVSLLSGNLAEDTSDADSDRTTDNGSSARKYRLLLEAERAINQELRKEIALLKEQLGEKQRLVDEGSNCGVQDKSGEFETKIGCATAASTSAGLKSIAQSEIPREDLTMQAFKIVDSPESAHYKFTITNSTPDCIAWMIEPRKMNKTTAPTYGILGPKQSLNGTLKCEEVAKDNEMKKCGMLLQWTKAVSIVTDPLRCFEDNDGGLIRYKNIVF